MIVKIKGIYHERTEDAPFIGALICANDCNFNCKNCFNQHLKELPTLYLDSIEIINQVKANKFNDGIILGGLEWTLQPKEMMELIKLALKEQLQVILYTGNTLDDLKKDYSEIFALPIYIKYGRYIDELKIDNYVVYNVNLASSNQNIVKLGGIR